MPRVQIILETPALVRVGLPIVTVAAYDIQRELDAAGSWAVEFPANEALASQVRTRYRISIQEEGRPGYLLRRGIVTDRQFNIDRTGEGVLRLSGFTRLFGVASQSTHLGQNYIGAPIAFIVSDLVGETVIAPSVPDAGSRQPTVTFNEMSKLAAALTALEYARCSIRETFDEDTFELVAWDNPPDSGFRFVNVAQVGPDLDSAASRGMGLIAGAPRIGYNGRELATRIIPVAVDHDGNPLTLAPVLALPPQQPYPVLTGFNPDSTPFYYLEDANATARSELIEMQLVRSDVKNPSDDPGTRTLAALALYAVAAGTLLARKADVIAFACEIANGAQIDVLPGDRVKIQFRGRAAGFGGGGSVWTLDQWFLVNKRRDAAATAGVRGVSFTLTAPEVKLRIPSLPDAVPIPPPPSPPPDPPPPSTQDPTGDGETPEDPLNIPAAPEVPPLPEVPLVPPKDFKPPGAPGPYQPCCPDPGPNNGGGNTPPPDDIEDDDGMPTPPEEVAWIDIGGASSPPTSDADHYAGCAYSSNMSPTLSDISATLLGEITLTHGGSRDDSPPTLIEVWGLRVTGPAPSISGVFHQRWWKATGSLEGHGVAWEHAFDVAEAQSPYPNGPASNFDLNVSMTTPGLPDDKAVALTVASGLSIYNQNSGSDSGGYGALPAGASVGPQTVAPYSGTTNWSPGINPVGPDVCMWIWVSQIGMFITS